MDVPVSLLGIFTPKKTLCLWSAWAYTIDHRRIGDKALLALSGTELATKPPVSLGQHPDPT